MRVASTTLGLLGGGGGVSAWATAGRDGSGAGSPLQDTLQALSSFASNNNRQADEAKVGLLKQRLEVLKMMLRFASPAELKKFAQELKSIARELAAVGEQVSGGSSSGGQPVAASVTARVANAQSPDAADTANAGAPVAATRQEAQAASGAVGTAESRAAPGAVRAHASAGGRQQGAADGDASLRAILTEARRKLAEVLTALKAKSRELDGEARRDLQAAERALGTLDKALGEAGGSVPAAGPGAVGSFTSWVGMNVDVRV